LIDAIPAEPGTYVVRFKAVEAQTFTIGRLGTLVCAPGFYFYIGSAFGPGGLRARLRHHLGRSRVPRWHVDYLKRSIKIDEIWFTRDARRLEHTWASSLSLVSDMGVPLRRFGASDCRCDSHLFYSAGERATTILAGTGAYLIEQIKVMTK
jgi:Uri superfamily endonuclease